MGKYIFIIALCFVFAFSSAQSAYAADLTIGVPNWSSARVTAHVLKRLIEERFDLEVGLQDGTNEEIFAGMDKGAMHIHPETWLPNHTALYNQYIIKRKTVVMSDKGVPAVQGICVTRQTAEDHDIKSIHDLASPQKARLFDTDGNGRGEIWIGAADWSSTRIERIRAKGYGYAKTMDLLEAEETIALAAIDAAVATGKPLVFYCYQPHHLFELHEIIQLDEPPTDPRLWNIVDPAKDPQWLEKSHAAVAWPQSFFHISYSKKLEKKYPKVAAFLSSIVLDVDTVSTMTYALVVERQDPAAFSKQWVSANADRIEKWASSSK